jgi:hypothetical protein
MEPDYVYQELMIGDWRVAIVDDWRFGDWENGLTIAGIRQSAA